jgi:hypothetical protein
LRQQAEIELAAAEHQGAAAILELFRATRKDPNILTAAVVVDDTFYVATEYAEDAYFLVAVPRDRVVSL